MRGAGNARWSDGRVFLEGEVAVTAMFYTGDQDVGDEEQNYLHVIGGAGAYLSPQLAVIGEIATLADAFDESDGDENFFHTLHAGLRYEGAGLTIGAQYMMFLDESARDQDVKMVSIDALARL